MNLIQTLEAEAIDAAHQGSARSPNSAPATRCASASRWSKASAPASRIYEGVCIARSNKGIELQLHRPQDSASAKASSASSRSIRRASNSIEVVRRGAVRRAKLYYLRGRTGKSARIAERRDPRREAAKAEEADAEG